ncbi:MAG: DUF1217 domain-containing protein [Alphaproteobacteria bacterium]|nr:DUF1217 domain-containing protein [Alphaproteobacteria bacterium]
MTSAIGAGNALTTWYSLSKTSEDTRVASYIKNNKQVQAATENFQRAAASLKSPDDLFKPQNYKLLNYILTAYGLQSEIGNTGELKQVINSDLTDQNSLANRMNDPRFGQLALALNFKAGGLTNIQNTSIQAGITARYNQSSYEIDLGNQNPAVRQAQYFKNNIGSITDIYSVLGDNTLRSVVSTTGNIPLEVAVQDLGTQAQVFSRQFDVSKAKDAGYVNRFIQRFLANSDMKATNSGASDPTVQLLQGAGSDGSSFDLSLISNINLLV